MAKNLKSRQYKSKKERTYNERRGNAHTIMWALRDIQDSYKPKKPLCFNLGF